MHNRTDTVPYSEVRKYLLDAFSRHRATAPKAGIWTLVLERDILEMCDRAAETARSNNDKG